MTPGLSEAAPGVGLPADPVVVFLFGGVGTHGAGTDLAGLRTAPLWGEVDELVQELTGEGLEAYLQAHRASTEGEHTAVIATVINLLHGSLWRACGQEPAVAVGHSVGEVAAAHSAGLLTVREALTAARALGRVAATQAGGMLFTVVDDIKAIPADDGLFMSGLSYANQRGARVSVSGPVAALDKWLASDKQAVRIPSAHPWHHPLYANTPTEALPATSGPSSDRSCVFVSAAGGGRAFKPEDCLDEQHWRTWLTEPNSLDAALRAAKGLAPSGTAVVIECGAHPVARGAAQVNLQPLVHVASMHRDVPAFTQLQESRAALQAATGSFASQLRTSMAARCQDLQCTWTATFANQGIDSARVMLLAGKLAPYLPGLQVPDLYRHTSLAALADAWDAKGTSASAPVSALAKQGEAMGQGQGAMILGTGCRLPGGVHHSDQLWAALEGEYCAIDDKVGEARIAFDHLQEGKRLGLSPAELKATDPQQVLALAVVDAMWTQLDSTVADRVLAAKGRVGVYLGVWQASALGPSASAYGVLGSASTAVLAARVANTYDFQGPALTVNTACSSSLVAVDLALADLRRGRIDYAIVGGVNLLDRSGLVSQHLRKGNFLSPTSRCHTFSAKADGYVRGEGGACFLLGRDDGVSPCHALVVGASVNQNSRREPITSVDPQAQTNLLRAACADAGLEPRDLAAVEMHGTGTRIGDPVEVSALAQLLGSSSTSKHCYLTAAKMHMGHLESAAGALGLLKAVLMVQERAVPRFTVPEPNPLVTQAMLGTCLRLPTSAPARLASEALVGVSSFGFAGNNAHAIVRGVPEARAMPRAATPAGCACCTRPLALDAPAQAMPVATPVLHAPVAVATPKELKLADAAGMPVKALVLAALAEVGVDVSEELDPSTSVLDLGLDSLAMAELSSLLHIDMDDLFEDPSVASVLALVAATGRAATTAAAPAADLISSTGARSKATNEEATKSTGSPASLKSRVLAALAEVGAEVEEDVDMTTSVLDLGLDSLGMAELASLLHIDMDLIFEDPSIANVIDLAKQAPVSESVAAPLASLTPAPGSSQPREVVSAPTPATAPASASPTLPPSTSRGIGWIRTTHVGSLPRPPGGTVDESLGIREIVRRQREGGFDVINDGEWSRSDYISDTLSRIEGFSMGGDESATPGKGALVDMPLASDMLDVPGHAKRFTGLNGLITLNPAKPARSSLSFVSAPLYMAGGASKCKATMQPFLDAVDAENHPRQDCFWTAPSPGTVALFCRDDYNGDYKSYVMALAAELRHEYEAIAASGVLLQLDAPCLAMGRHTRFAYMTDEEWCGSILRVNVEAINLAVANIPAHQIRLHVCWGNYPGPHHKDIEASLLWGSLCQLNVKYLLVEMANPRHASDIEAIRAVADKLEDKVICVGVVDTITPRVEHPRLVANRLVALANIVGPNRVMAGPDCGFASTAKSMANTPDVSWLKVTALVQGARLATSMLFDANAAVSTPFLATTATARVVLVHSPSELKRAHALHKLLTESTTVAHLVLVSTEDADPLLAVRWRLDWPVLCVAMSAAADKNVEQICTYVNHQSELPRRPATALSSSNGGSKVVEQLCEDVCARVRDMGSYDKRTLCIPMHSTRLALPERVTVVVVGAGLLGLYAGNKLAQEGFDVIVLDRRAVAGGIWSLYANSTSQVNTSEGGYSVKELLPKESPANKDHSSTKEILGDLEALATQLGPRLRLGVTVNSVGKDEAGDYRLDVATSDGGSHLIRARGVMMCINDRVGVPRPLDVPMAPGCVPVVPGIADAAAVAGLEWRGKKVVIVGIGAFAVENARTALESGATHVTVVCRRMGTVCPKIIDYANFTADWDENFQHDMKGNAKQFQRWNRLYKQSGAVVPPGWPKQIKPKGHTISVSDIWFVGHKLGKLATKVGAVKTLEPSAVCLEDGTRIECDVVVPCLGFIRNTDLCVKLTGLKHVADTNYLDKHLMYLADAEIDDNAFNSFFGSSVLEYGKFFTNVFMEGLRREEELGPALWGPDVPRLNITDRAWSHYIASAKRLVTSDKAINTHARQQVDLRTKQFFKNLPTDAYEATNRQDWEDLHVLLGAAPDQRLPHFADL